MKLAQIILLFLALSAVFSRRNRRSKRLSSHNKDWESIVATVGKTLTDVKDYFMGRDPKVVMDEVDSVIVKGATCEQVNEKFNSDVILYAVPNLKGKITSSCKLNCSHPKLKEKGMCNWNGKYDVTYWDCFLGYALYPKVLFAEYTGSSDPRKGAKFVIAMKKSRWTLTDGCLLTK
jgi:hypothetical protein